MELITVCFLTKPEVNFTVRDINTTQQTQSQ